MHEMSLMTEMAELLAKSAKENHIGQITRVKLVVGKMTMALPDALKMAFEVLRAAAPFSPDAVLEIEERETKGLCGDCGASFLVENNYRFVCPFCQGLKIDILSGRELYVEHYEGEEETAL